MSNKTQLTTTTKPTNQPSMPMRVPYDELQLAHMMAEPAWGKECPPELYAQVVEIVSSPHKDPKTGMFIVDAKPLWGLLGYYTRDVRLGNLDSYGVIMCEYYLNLAGDCLRNGLVRGFLAALTRAITRLEVSQSKDGFGRKRAGTVTTEKFEHVHKTDKDLMGQEKKQ